MGDFWSFWAKVAPNGGSLGHQVGRKVLNKRAPHPYGARSEAIRRVYLGCTVPLVPKYTRRMASDLAPYGWGTLFSNTLRPIGCPRDPPFGATLAKMAKNHPKWGYPLFDQFFSKVTEIHPSNSPIFGKKCGFPPRRMAQRGENLHFFFENFRKWGLDFCYLPEKVVKKGVPPFLTDFGVGGRF